MSPLVTAGIVTVTDDSNIDHQQNGKKKFRVSTGFHRFNSQVSRNPETPEVQKPGNQLLYRLFIQS